MTKIEALTVTDVEASSVPDDANHALVRVATPQGPLTLVIPAEQIQSLMQLLSTAGGQIAKKRQQNPNVKWVASVEWWEFGTHSDQLVLAFRMPGGAEQAFQVHRDQAVQMRDVLSAIVGDGPALAPTDKTN